VAWQDALDVLCTMLAVMLVAQLVRRWRRSRGTGQRPQGSLPLRNLFLAKLALVASVLVAEDLMQHWIPLQPARMLAAAGLGIGFATIGPVLHRRHNSPAPRRRRHARG
jgi:hypothetical protein